MTRGRKPAAPAAEVLSGETLARTEPAIRTDLAALDAAGADIEARNCNAVAVAQSLGYDGALTVGALEDEIRFYQHRSVEACLELGKRLLILREITRHGEFQQRTELLGIERRLAQRLMAATLKFSKAASTPLLKAAGTQTKLLELVALDDAEIEALDAGDSVRGLKLDDIETMSVRELRAALREAKADSEAAKRVAAEKNTKIDALARDLEKTRRLVESRPPDERVEALRLLTGGKALAVESAIANELDPAVGGLLAADESLRPYLDGLFAQIEQRLADTRARYGLAGRAAFGWIADTDAA